MKGRRRISRRRLRRWLTGLALLGLAGCAHGPVLPASGPPAPQRQSWLPETEPRAVILAVHGFNDYSGAFADFGAFAAAHGIALHAYDQRGFGSSFDAGYWPGQEVLLASLGAERARIAAEFPGRPVYLLGLSMGAAVIMEALAQDRVDDVAGAILVAPAVWGGEFLNPFYRATLWVMKTVTPNASFTGEGVEVHPSDNLPMLRAFAADPLVIKETRVAAIAGLVDVMDRALAAAPDVPGPLLVLRGARDDLIPPDAHAAMLARLRAAPCRAITYPEGYHMLLRDLQRRVVWQDILAWIGGQPPPSGLARPCGSDRNPTLARR